MKNLFEEMDMCFRIEVVASPSFVWFVLAVTSAVGESARSASRGSEFELILSPHEYEQ